MIIGQSRPDGWFCIICIGGGLIKWLGWQVVTRPASSRMDPRKSESLTLRFFGLASQWHQGESITSRRHASAKKSQQEDRRLAAPSRGVQGRVVEHHSIEPTSVVDNNDISRQEGQSIDKIQSPPVVWHSSALEPNGITHHVIRRTTKKPTTQSLSRVIDATDPLIPNRQCQRNLRG